MGVEPQDINLPRMGASMGQDLTRDLAPDIPRRPPWRRIILTGLVVVGLTVLVLLFRDRIAGLWQGANEGDNRLVPGALDDYIPEDSEAVLAIDVKSLRAAPVVQQYFLTSLRQIVGDTQETFAWIEMLGVNPLEDVDTLLVSFAPGSGGQPLWLARGRLDRSRFQTGPDKLQRDKLSSFHVWKYSDRKTRRQTLLAPAGDALVVSDTPARVQAALRQASDPQAANVRDATLRDQLAQVDRRSSLWFAASFKDLGAVARIDNFWLEKILRPLFRYAESVRGHIACAEDLRAALHFHSATEENAVKLQEDLNNLCGVAAGAQLFVGRHKELLPLLRLLATGETNRDGLNVSLRCRVTAEQLGQ
jgi:hypothetical protein